MSAVTDIRNVISPQSPEWGVVISVDESSVSVGVSGKVKQFQNHSDFKVGDKVVVENENIRHSSKIPVRTFEV
jgi:hypothetical protein